MPRVLAPADRVLAVDGERLALSLLLVAMPVCILLDAVILSDHIGEGGLTETMQSGLVLFSALLFLEGFLRLRQSYLGAAGLFLLALFVRENDALLDHVQQGFWAFVVLPILLIAAFIAWRGRGDLRQGLARHRASGTLLQVLVGLGILILFSRLAGSGMVWRPILGENYSWQIKSTIQEGLELVGHAWLACGSYLSWKANFGQPGRQPL